VKHEERLARLEAARDKARDGEYHRALELTQAVLDAEPYDLNALALKGNILDYQYEVAAELGLSDLAAEASEEARHCYETMLQIDGENVRALIDMGDHCAVRSRHEDALGWFDRALSELDAGRYFSSLDEDLAEALARKRDSLIALNRVEEAVAVNADGRRRCPGSDSFS
jgi:tetratricopeptide (TPR) repeat protein